MDEKLRTPLAIGLLWVAFAVVSLLLATGLGPRRLLPVKLRVGALLLALSAVAVHGCGEGEEMCYAAPYEPDDTDGDTDTDTDADTDTDTDR